MKSPLQQQLRQPSSIEFHQEQRFHFLSQFLQNNKTELIKNISLQKVKATIVPDTPEYLPILAETIRNGQLVAFPTETVYGLGADATNQQALLSIYRIKKRPLTDPIIVHVTDMESALKLVIPQSQLQMKLFTTLAEHYWPGPLTIILKANLNILPNVVTAQTGYVGLRSPKCKYARNLIQSSLRPIGAPSANLFSHVSPTSAVHVFNDFFNEQVTIVDGEKCQFGVESTVVKIINGNLQIFREGSLSTTKLEQFVLKQFGNSVRITTKKRMQKHDEEKNMEAPGQMLKHYAPYLPCFITTLDHLQKAQRSLLHNSIQNQQINFNEIAFVSFSSLFDSFQHKFKFYLSINDSDGQEQPNQQNKQQTEKFCTLQQKKKMKSLYYLLRKAQNLDVKIIIIGWNDNKQGTLWDKIFRCTQGYTAQLL